MSKQSLNRPPRKDFLSFSPPLIGEEEKAEVMDTLESGWITKGPKTERFEEEFAAYSGVKAASALNSCTAALHLALLALNVGPGDEVITPTFTFTATGHSILYTGATPILVDCDPLTINIAVDEIEAKITERTKVIMPVHYGGQPCPMDDIHAIARKHGIKVVEDAAHAAGAEYNGRKIGGLSDVSCFSFYATKNLTTGDGGMATSDDEEIINRIKILSSYGIGDARKIWQRYAPQGSWWYDVQELGFKYNLTDIQAALGIQQLKKLDGFIERRTMFSNIYDEGFAEIPEVITPKEIPNIRHPRHLYPLMIKPEMLNIDRNQFIEELKDEHIGTSVLYIPLHMHSFYREKYGYKPEDFPNALHVFERIINLPVSPIMRESDVLDVVASVGRIIAKHRV